MKKLISHTVLVLLGNALLAIGYAAFAIPTNLIVGGATGMALVIEHITSIDYALIVFVINMLMLVIGYYVLGKAFAIGTLLSSFAFPAFLSLFENMPILQNISDDILLCTVWAGIFVGLGLGIVFRIGYSTGGMDVPPIILAKKTHISVAAWINIFDSFILLAQVLFTDLEGILYGLLVVFITNFVLDQVIVFGEKNLQVFVISAKHEEISQAIFDGINRGCTFVNVKTGYFHHNQLAVLCVLNNREYAKLNELVLDIDPTAFIISNEIHSVKGRGFTLPNIDLEKK